MANESEQTDKSDTAGKPSQRSAAEQSSPAVAEQRLGVGGWQERSRGTFGASPHAVAGALAGQDASDFSEDEVRQLLDEFSVREGT